MKISHPEEVFFGIYRRKRRKIKKQTKELLYYHSLYKD